MAAKSGRLYALSTAFFAGLFVFSITLAAAAALDWTLLAWFGLPQQIIVWSMAPVTVGAVAIGYGFTLRALEAERAGVEAA